MERKRVIIMGAAGRDFHNFNTYFRNNEEFEVVAFTATQIPYIEDRMYPPVLSGKLYPDGIPIHGEEELPELIKNKNIDIVVFAYSDVRYGYVMNRSALVNALGADFMLLGTNKTYIKSNKPVISICAVRTGCGKSQTTRYISEILKKMGKKIAAIRHPMPYGDLAKQAVQRYGSLEDMDKHECTIEEREEYELHIRMGNVLYAGVDYGAILAEAEKEADVILWDGGNNDLPFYKPDLHITVADPLRVGHETSYYPGEANLRAAHAVVINKMDSAAGEDVAKLEATIKELNPNAAVVKASSPVSVEDPSIIKDKMVLCVEDGPTLTHGEMTYGAGVVAAKRFGAKDIVDPRPYLKGTIDETFRKYPKIGTLLPAMGYSPQQVKDLEDTINATDCDSIIIGTPIDLRNLININKPAVWARYELEEAEKGVLEKLVKKIV